MNTADYLLAVGDDSQSALVTNRQTYSYREVRHASARLLGELIAAGLQPGDRIGIFDNNSLFWVAAYLAILKLGAIAVPFPTVATPDDFAVKADLIQCKGFCLTRSFQRRFDAVLPPGAGLITEQVLDQPGPVRWENPQEEFDLDQDAALMLTSGTTARPRAVRITHRNIQANTDSIIEYLELGSQERILVALPFYYCFGTSLLHTHLRVGGSLALCNTFAYPETALDMIEATAATGFAGVPSTFQTLLRNTTFPKRELPTLRKVQQAGGKLPVVFIKELVASLPQAKIFVMYGQTEATARLSYLPPERLDAKLGSVGRGIPGVELQIFDEEGKPVAVGDVGEIVARGDNISPGYFNEPEASAEKFINGALHTGDLAKIDEDGYIYIVDRKSDFIKSMGHRVSSQEIESHILKLPEVVAAAAIGQPDELMGEAILVFVTIQKSAQISPEDILDYCRKNMTRHMVPKSIFIVDHIPTNAHGKFVKSELRQLAETMK